MLDECDTPLCPSDQAALHSLLLAYLLGINRPIVARRDSPSSVAHSPIALTADAGSHMVDPRQLAVVFATVQDAVVLTAADGRVIDCNPAAERLLGCARDALLTRALPNGIGIIDVAADDAARAAALRDGRWEGERSFVSRDGRSGILHSTLIPTRDESTGVTTLVGVHRDITEQRSAEEALRESEKRLRFALEGANEGLWDWSIDTGDVYFSAAAELMLGYEPGEMERRTGGTWDQSLHPDDMPAVQRAIDEHVAGHTSAYEAEYRCRTKQGGWKWILGRGKVVERRADGSPSRMTGIHIDITERKQAEETRARLTAILDATPDLVAIATASFTTLYMNPAGRRMLGLAEHADLTGRWIGNTLSERMRRQLFDVAIPTAARDGFWRGESAFMGADGEEHPATQIVLAHRSPLGNVESYSTVIRDDTERLRAESVVRESEERHRLLFEENPIPLLVMDAETLMFLAVNAAAVRQYGYSREEFSRMSITDIRPTEDATLALARAAAPQEVRSQRSGPYRHQRKDGSIVVVDVVSRDFVFAGRSARLVLAIDVTEQRHLEDQLRQSQKIEAVGQLAGGIAHDFNNLLTIIKGNVELALHQLPAGVPLRNDLEQVAHAASRAALLTRQLLAFSRKQVLTPAVLDLNDVVAEAERMLRRVIGEDITFVSRLAPVVSRVTADRGQIEQVLVNLVVNARDAMPAGGVLTVATADEEVSVSEATMRGIRPGAYVTLRVHDTGTGMDDATRSRIFEPFFTTKPVGRGTGLGLATVYGVVHQSGGFVVVDSAPGDGSTFTIYLPRTAHAECSRGMPRSDAIQRGSETVLLVEDEDEVRAVARRVLEEAGYTVLEAANAAEALETFDRSSDSIAMLVSDVVMPGLNGHELCQMLRLRAPRLPTLFVSGYSFDARGSSSAFDDESFLEKPYDPAELARRVRSIIDAAAV
jgi:two-component system cell cycle sensor histidine kinase/response regulator CckA